MKKKVILQKQDKDDSEEFGELGKSERAYPSLAVRGGETTGSKGQTHHLYLWVLATGLCTAERMCGTHGECRREIGRLGPILG